MYALSREFRSFVSRGRWRPSSVTASTDGQDELALYANRCPPRVFRPCVCNVWYYTRGPLNQCSQFRKSNRIQTQFDFVNHRRWDNEHGLYFNAKSHIDLIFIKYDLSFEIFIPYCNWLFSNSYLRLIVTYYKEEFWNFCCILSLWQRNVSTTET